MNHNGCCESRALPVPQTGSAVNSKQNRTIRNEMFIRLRQNTLQLDAGMNGEAIAP
jgi:hypothetical protein